MGPTHGVDVNWSNLPAWSSSVTVTGRFGDATNFSYVQGFDTDPLHAGNDLTIRVSEFFAQDTATNTSSATNANGLLNTEFNFDHLGDTQSYTTNAQGDQYIAFGPYSAPTNHDFGIGDAQPKPKIVARDYSRDLALDPTMNGYAQVMMDFSAYTQGVQNVRVRLHDVDWRGNYGGGNNEQDRVSGLYALTVNSLIVPLTAQYEPWYKTSESSNQARNSYIIYSNGTLNMEIIGRNAGTNDASANAVLTLNPTNGVVGFQSSDSEGFGNVLLSTEEDVAVSAIFWLWGGNPNNLTGGNPQRGWGHEIGLISYEPVPEADALLGLAIGGLAVACLRRRILRGKAAPTPEGAHPCAPMPAQACRDACPPAGRREATHHHLTPTPPASGAMSRRTTSMIHARKWISTRAACRTGSRPMRARGSLTSISACPMPFSAAARSRWSLSAPTNASAWLTGSSRARRRPTH